MWGLTAKFLSRLAGVGRLTAGVEERVETHVQKRKLIEVALPLEAINRESAREKSIRHGHPSTLHLWWARRPLAAARAVLFAQLVDDPSAHPDLFPTEQLQREERDRLHRLIERLVVWENTRDRRLLAEARAEVLKSTGGNPPSILDPFAGGGTIPLEAQRLGLEAHASDLNPVAVLINKALVEIPAEFTGQTPVFPGLAESQIRSWSGAEGLAADVRSYGGWIRERAEEQVGFAYPQVQSPDGTMSPVIAWIWSRTVKCPNPACAIDLPLVRSWWLGKRYGQEAFIRPSVVEDMATPSGRRVDFRVVHGSAGSFDPDKGTVDRRGARCISCGAEASLDYVRREGKAKRMGQVLMAVVGEGERRRLYTSPTDEHRNAAQVRAPTDPPIGEIAKDGPGAKNVPLYGLTRFADLFTARQLLTLTTFSDLIGEARLKVVEDGGSERYADAVATYLAFTISRLIDRNNTICTWDSGPVGSKASTGGSARTASVRNAFARQALPMTWDFAESNPFSGSGGSMDSALDWIVPAIDRLGGGARSVVRQADARDAVEEAAVISTDPPYYDNIGYSDLSDFFYVWLRRSLRQIHPELLSTMLVPKAEELVANPQRHGGKDGARSYFEDGFREVFSRAHAFARHDIPITVWYAFKQSESDVAGEVSTGWETLLEGMIASGWEITSTWPARSEMGNRMVASGANALASSIVLSLRPREQDAATIDRRGFIASLETELPDALRKLQQGGIAPVDLPQAAIGPGMAVFSRFAAVLENDGSRMSVRSALARINEVLDEVLSEQEGDFDATTRFAIAWYRQHGYGVGKFGDADSLARARNTSVDVMDRVGILTSRAGSVHLIKPAELAWDYDVVADLHTSNWEALHHLVKTLERDGIAPAGDFLRSALSRADRAVDADLVKELGHLMFRIAEGNGWTKDALSFNSMVTSWPDIIDVVRKSGERRPSAAAQGAFEFDEDE